MAGSEKESKHSEFTDVLDLKTSKKQNQRQEGSNINKSLLALANCIKVLSDNRTSAVHIPYRDSKLTRILKDSLGGNAKTVLIACVFPTLQHIDETINTLKYASIAKKIKNMVKKNISNNIEEDKANEEFYISIVDKLKSYIEQLKAEINQTQLQNIDASKMAWSKQKRRYSLPK